MGPIEITSLSHNIWCPGRDSNAGPSEYKYRHFSITRAYSEIDRHIFDSGLLLRLLSNPDYGGKIFLEKRRLGLQQTTWRHIPEGLVLFKIPLASVRPITIHASLFGPLREEPIFSDSNDSRAYFYELLVLYQAAHMLAEVC
jgi:hypothetical protein